jgi:hypothetical protein
VDAVIEYIAKIDLAKYTMDTEYKRQVDAMLRVSTLDLDAIAAKRVLDALVKLAAVPIADSDTVVVTPEECAAGPVQSIIEKFNVPKPIGLLERGRALAQLTTIVNNRSNKSMLFFKAAEVSAAEIPAPQVLPDVSAADRIPSGMIECLLRLTWACRTCLLRVRL